MISDELLQVTEKILSNLDIRLEAIEKNLETYAPFSCTERIMMLASKRGADRQIMHELLRKQAQAGWQVVQRGGKNPLVDNLKNDPQILKWVSVEEIDQLLTVSGYTGTAKEKTMAIAARVRSLLI